MAFGCDHGDSSGHAGITAFYYQADTRQALISLTAQQGAYTWKIFAFYYEADTRKALISLTAQLGAYTGKLLPVIIRQTHGKPLPV